MTCHFKGKHCIFCLFYVMISWFSLAGLPLLFPSVWNPPCGSSLQCSNLTALILGRNHTIVKAGKDLKIIYFPILSDVAIRRDGGGINWEALLGGKILQKATRKGVFFSLFLLILTFFFLLGVGNDFKAEGCGNV